MGLKTNSYMTDTTGMFRKGHFRCGVLGVQNELGL